MALAGFQFKGVFRVAVAFAVTLWGMSASTRTQIACISSLGGTL